MLAQAVDKNQGFDRIIVQEFLVGASVPASNEGLRPLVFFEEGAIINLE